MRAARGRGRFVIRYDQRDTGRSTYLPRRRAGLRRRTWPRTRSASWTRSGSTSAHVVGRSMSGGTALILGVDHPDRVASLTFVSTTTGDDELRRRRAAAGAPTSPTRRAGRVRRRDGRSRPGSAGHFDEDAARDLVERDMARARDYDGLDDDEPLRDGLRRPRSTAGSVTSRCRRWSCTARWTRSSRRARRRAPRPSRAHAGRARGRRARHSAAGCGTSSSTRSPEHTA